MLKLEAFAVTELPTVACLLSHLNSELVEYKRPRAGISEVDHLVLPQEYDDGDGEGKGILKTGSSGVSRIPFSGFRSNFRVADDTTAAMVC